MNERIKLLAEQANGPNPFFGRLKNQTVLLGDDAVERFAELIVRECVAMADEFEIEVNRSGLVDRMKEHFGVEK